MYTEEQLEQAFHAGKEYAHAARNGQPTIGLRFDDWKQSLVKESDSLPCVSMRDLYGELRVIGLSHDNCDKVIEWSKTL